MRIRTVIVFCTALVFGAVAVFTARAWLQGQRNLIFSAAQNISAPSPELGTIVVAAKPLRFGDRIQPDHVREISWPAGQRPNGSFKTNNQLLKPGARYVTSAIETDEPILAWKITGPGQRATLSAALSEGLKAITIRVNDILGVAGFVLPGDRVDVLLTRQNKYVDVLLQGVKVLAIDQTADDRRDKPAVVKAVTFEVSTKEAQVLTLAARIGQLSLALRNIASADVEKTKRVTLADLAGGANAATELEETLGDSAEPVALREALPAAPRIPPPVTATATEAPGPAKPKVGVYRNFKRRVYTVIRTEN